MQECLMKTHKNVEAPGTLQIFLAKTLEISTSMVTVFLRPNFCPDNRTDGIHLEKPQD